MGLRSFYRVAALVAGVWSALIIVSGAASAQPYPWSYRHGWGPVMYDEGFFVGAAPQYPAAVYSGGYGRRFAYSAADVYLAPYGEAEVALEPVIRRDFVPVTAYQPVDTIIGFQPVVRHRPVRHVRRSCQCNGFY